MVDKNCVRCRKLRKHYAKGLCNSCYICLRRNKEKHKIYLKRWRDKNPEYFKNYYKINKEKLNHKKDKG